MVRANPDRNFALGIFAYHLNRPSTHRFSHVNGKQPTFLKRSKAERETRDSGGAIHSTKISGNFGPKLNGSVRSNRKSFEKTGPPFEVVLFSRSDRLEFWLNGSRPGTLCDKAFGSHSRWLNI